MKIITFLHFYQPHNQQEDILNRIVNESYKPILEGLLKRENSKLVANVPGVLLDLLTKHGYEDVVNHFVLLVERGQIEITGSSMYHAFLPLLPKDEIIRQIDVNNTILKKYFKNSYKPEGFFSPELAVSDKVVEVASDQGFKWIAASQVAYGQNPPKHDSIYKSATAKINVLFRHKPASYIMLSAMAKSAEELKEELRDMWDENEYWFTVMDAETFGHHRIGHEKLLFDIWDSDLFDVITVSDLLNTKLPTEEVTIRPSTWTNEEQDFWLDKEKTKQTMAKSYILWNNPKNPIHKLQWELTDLAISEVHTFSDKETKRWKEAREALDKAIASDQYWWASAKPWWSLEMIEQGAFALKGVLETLKNDKSMKKSEELYRAILDKAFEWQRTGYIRKKHVEDSGTYMKEPFKERAPDEWCNQMVLEFEYEMNKAAANRNYEKAIKWRDALTKIKEGNDIYDIRHVVDDLWLGRNVPWGESQVKPFLEHDWDEFSDFAKDHFINVSNKEEFEKWKSSK
jgi:hypothetical protein